MENIGQCLNKDENSKTSNTDDENPPSSVRYEQECVTELHIVPKDKTCLRDIISRILETPIFSALRKLEEKLNKDVDIDVLCKEELRAILKHDSKLLTLNKTTSIPEDIANFLNS